MTTGFFTHPVCLEHYPNDGHPECRERIESILAGLEHPDFSDLKKISASKATPDDLLLGHSAEHIDFIFDQIPAGVALNFLDRDTAISSKSGDAALYAVGAVLDATTHIANKELTHAFCAVRPPGHHAHREKSWGFCLFNSVAIGAISAIERHGLSRVAIVDFDIHHGDGTQNIVWDRDDVLFISTHQKDIFPFSGTENETGAHNNILNIPIPAGTKSEIIQDIFNSRVIPRLNEFKPEMIFVSAGFDAHWDDPIGEMQWVTSDYAAIMASLLDVAHTHGQGRLLAVLEGGYDTDALQSCVRACIKTMLHKDQSL